MSVERFSPDPQPLLLDSVEDRLVGLLLKAAGLLLLLSAVVLWLSLATWSAQDPSLTHATSGLTRNWLGPLGAIVADLLLQTLGFAAIFVPLGLALPGLELYQHRRISGLKLRLGLFPVAILALAGAFGSLPAPGSWPLNHSLGGILGDMAFGAVSGLLAVINPARAGAASGLLLFAGGMCLLSSGLGLGQREWSLLWQSSPRAAGTSAASATGILGRLLGWLPQRTRHTPMPEREPATADTRAAKDVPAPTAPSPVTEHTFYREADAREPAEVYEPPAPRAPARRPVSEPQRTPNLHLGEPDADTGFDRSTEQASRAMAERFAPARDSFAPKPRSAAEIIGSLISFRPSGETPWKKPSLNLLKRPTVQRPGAEFTQPVLRGSARLLEDVLNDFGIKGEVKDIRPGPVVTLFEMEPARGVKSARVIALADDIARSMSATSARVAIVPGRNAIGIELPNVRRETVLLRELLETEAWRASDAQLPITLGKGIGGEPVIADLARMPHLLVAGTTGSGKSVGVNAMILSLLYRLSPAECRFLMIDPKMLELSVYNGIPHLLAPVVTDPHRAAAALGWAVSEMEERYKRMAQLGVRNIEIFNNRIKNAKKRGELVGRTVQTGFDAQTGEPIYAKEQGDSEPMPYIVIVVDEFADLMIVAGKEVEAAVQRLAQMARAAGIHLIMATQRPSVDVVTGTIKANFPTRISFKVASRIDSRTILNEQGAEQLLGQGDMLYSAGGGQVLRVHGAFVADEEVETITRFLREQGEPRYIEGITDDASAPDSSPQAAAAETADDIYDKAVAIVLRDRKASTSYLQRRLSIGYNRAADLIERMEADGIVGPANSVGKRDILAAGTAADAA
ncbi:MAG: DNA translocase FtsK [Hyphomicrobiaceae bacterium]